MENLSNIEKCYMDELKSLLKANFPIGMFAVGYSVDSAACILKEDDGWHVFTGCKNVRTNEKVYPNTILACLDEISRVSMSDEEQVRLQALFLDTVCPPKEPEETSSVA